MAPESVLDEALGMASTIASKSRTTVAIGKEAFYRQLEQPLHELTASGGLRACSVETAVHAVFALLHGLVWLDSDRGDIALPPDLFDAALGAMLRGFASSPPDSSRSGAHA